MNRYKKGADFERKVEALYRSIGCDAVRAAGSHGIYDVLAISPNKETIYYIQCKTDGNISIADWNELVVHAQAYGGVPILASKHPTGGIKLEWMTDRARLREERAKVDITDAFKDSGSELGAEGDEPSEVPALYPPGYEPPLD